jgi:hypothetical protein
MRVSAMVARAVALGLAALAGGGAAAVEASGTRAAGERLGVAIERALKAEGPFFTAEERAVVERKCGYAAGSWDGFEINIRDGALVCRDGRRVDDAEMRALLAVAEPRIEARVGAAMEREDVRGAIAAVAEEAGREAERAVAASRAGVEASLEAGEATRRAMAETRRAMREGRRAERRGGR